MKFFFFIIIAFYLACGGGNNSSNPIPTIQVRNGVEVSQALRQITPKGVTVFSSGGLPISSLNLIDSGMDRVFTNAKISGYTNQVGNYSYFQVYIPVKPCQLSPEWKIPGFRVHAPDYAGTQYDIGNGDILAAEMVLSDNEFIICPDEQYMIDATAWGTEHIILKLNDPPYYELSKNHGNGKYVHPLIPRHVWETVGKVKMNSKAKHK